MATAETSRQMFELFNEIGIIDQLGVTVFNRRMPQNLHVSHFSVLNHLVRLGDGQTPKKITAAFQVTKGTMSNTLNDLHERGFIQFEPHETDGRSKVVFLTKAGRDFQIKAIESLAPALQELTDMINVKELVACLPALRQLRMALDENRNAW